MSMIGKLTRNLMFAAASAALLAGAPALAQDSELAGAPGYQAQNEQIQSEQAQGDEAARQEAARQQVLGDLAFRDRDQDYRDGGFSGGRGDMALAGLRVDAAKDTLRRRGFTFARAIRDNGRQYDLWSSGRSCVGFTSYNGRVTDARNFREAECGYGGGYGDGGWGGGRFDVRELEGRSVDRAKEALRWEGFRAERSIRIDGRQYDLWSSGRACVGFASYNGRVTDARNFREAECDGYGGGWGNGPGGGGGWGGLEVRELEGLGVERAQDVLRREGYRFARSLRIDGRQYDLWRNGDYRNACVGFASYYGRVSDARQFSERECW